jgi:hypothetical protein
MLLALKFVSDKSKFMICSDSLSCLLAFESHNKRFKISIRYKTIGYSENFMFARSNKTFINFKKKIELKGFEFYNSQMPTGKKEILNRSNNTLCLLFSGPNMRYLFNSTE